MPPHVWHRGAPGSGAQARLTVPPPPRRASPGSAAVAGHTASPAVRSSRKFRETPVLAAYCASKATAWPGAGSLSCKPSCPATVGKSLAGPGGGTETLGDLPIRAPAFSRAWAAPSSPTPVPAPGPPSPAAEAWGCPSPSSSSLPAPGAATGSQGSWPRLAEGCQGLGLGRICRDAARRGFLRPLSSVPGAVLAGDAMAGRGDPRGPISLRPRPFTHAGASPREAHGPGWTFRTSSAPTSRLANESLQSYVGQPGQPIGRPVSWMPTARI